MATVMIANFAGMLPIEDPILLPDVNAQFSENAWLYYGAVRGFRQDAPVYTLQYSNTQQVYRIPTSDVTPPDFSSAGSLWLEFPDPYMAVVRNPTVDDQYNRYYFFPSDQFAGGGDPRWALCSQGPVYAPLANLQAGGPIYLLGIPEPTVAPTVTAPPYSVTLPVDTMSNVGGKYLHFSAAFNTAGVVVGMTVTDITQTTFTANTTADTASGDNVLTFSDTTGILGGMTVSTSSTIAGTTVLSVTPTTVTMDSAASADIVSGAEIIFTAVNPIIPGTTVVSIDNTVNPPWQPQVMVSNAHIAYVYLGDEINFQGTAESRAYVYTMVSAYGEESAPSPATVANGLANGTWTIEIPAQSADTFTNRNLVSYRLYRTVTDTSGNATYYQIAEVPINFAGTVTITDEALDANITANQVLPTLDFTPPPTGLQGVVMMANGIAAGFVKDREVWFSAAYLLHAWPGTYALAEDYPIVGLTANSSSLNVITEGSPFIMSGVTPDTITQAKVTANEPCVGRGSIVSSPEGSHYASPNGYILVENNGTTNWTISMLEKEFWWNELTPWNIVGGRFGTEMVMFIKGSLINDVNGAVITLPQEVSDANTTFTFIDTVTPVVNAMTDELSGQIFYITNQHVFQWNPPDGATLWPWIWKTKKFRFTFAQQFMAFLVYFDVPPEITFTPGVRNTDQGQIFNPATQYLIVRVYADGEQIVVREIQTSGEVILIPRGSKWTFWEFQFEGVIYLRYFKVASSVKELKAA